MGPAPKEVFRVTLQTGLQFNALLPKEERASNQNRTRINLEFRFWARYNSQGPE